MRFWTRANPSSSVGIDDIVSTLLEILGYATVVAFGRVALLTFQPFLRFWAGEDGADKAGPVEVSTLLEILVAILYRYG